jgi:multimeric flavodoxin WrbA
MQEIYAKIENADVIVIGTPNYYDNVSGLLKDFIDRTNPFYETGKLKGKKMITIAVGGGEIKNTEFVTKKILKNFAEAHEMTLLSSHCFQALTPTEVEKNPEPLAQIDSIVRGIVK